MKDFVNLLINPRKLLTNEELIALKGGGGYVDCRRGASAPQCGGWVFDCSMAREYCDFACPGWHEYICAG